MYKLIILSLMLILAACTTIDKNESEENLYLKNDPLFKKTMPSPENCKKMYDGMYWCGEGNPEDLKHPKQK